MKRTTIAFAAAGATFLLQASARAESISIKDSFRIGSGGTVLCTAQAIGSDAALTGMFDRGYTIVCRDAAVPVGRIYALRTSGGDAEQRLATFRAGHATCEQPTTKAVEGLGTALVAECHLTNADVGYRAYLVRVGKTLYAAEGLAGYDSALRLGLLTVIADQPVKGELSVATTGAGDPAAFARVQAGTLDTSRALAEAYRRNNAGSYAESAEFFESVRSGAGNSAQAEAVAISRLMRSTSPSRGRSTSNRSARSTIRLRPSGTSSSSWTEQCSGLPPNLLAMRDSDVAMYAKRAAAGGDAEFDFTGVHWLGRDRDVSTSVSALAFRDVRVAPHSAGEAGISRAWREQSAVRHAG